MILAWPHWIGSNPIQDLRLLIIFSSGLLLCILFLPAAALELGIHLLTSMSKHNKCCCARCCPHGVYQSIFVNCIARASKPIKSDNTNPFLQCRVLLIYFVTPEKCAITTSLPVLDHAKKKFKIQ
jgi:hypothetical protein